VYAISNLCTHDAGSLAEGETFGYVIECPRHGSRFDIRTGRVLSPPAAEDIRVFPVRVVDGAIQVDASS
ncbi:MAG: non-heme iron oxygenase ferredoxin subunit, partial [Chloroflexi bacterium]|nr:non-heme iron oxygenase ferredoxin subunit [Chloroflexota bacterium]